jgi:hypothetical protein
MSNDLKPCLRSQPELLRHRPQSSNGDLNGVPVLSGNGQEPSLHARELETAWKAQSQYK